MKLGKNYSIKSSSNNWILSYKSDEKTDENTGKKYHSTDEWYYSKLEDALNRYVDSDIKGLKTKEDILNKLEEVKQVIKTIKCK